MIRSEWGCQGCWRCLGAWSAGEFVGLIEGEEYKKGGSLKDIILFLCQCDPGVLGCLEPVCGECATSWLFDAGNVVGR